VVLNPKIAFQDLGRSREPEYCRVSFPQFVRAIVLVCENGSFISDERHPRACDSRGETLSKKRAAAGRVAGLGAWTWHGSTPSCTNRDAAGPACKFLTACLSPAPQRRPADKQRTDVDCAEANAAPSAKRPHIAR